MANELTDSKKLGVTHNIRARLNFLDEKLWKRFSARRLELIDTLDLSSKKASEQEEEIKNVAETLRLEFNYGFESFSDFDKLVRAAVQSARRNRKRSSKSAKNLGKSDPYRHTKRQNVDDLNYYGIGSSGDSIDSPPSVHDHVNYSNVKPSNGSGSVDSHWPKKNLYYNQNENEIVIPKKSFLSEISKLNSDSQEDYDLNYTKTKNFSIFDKSRAAIDNMIKPRIGIDSSNYDNVFLPSISDLNVESNTSNAKRIMLSYFERSRTCSEARLKSTKNLEVLGEGFISSCIAYLFEKSFESTSDTSIEYLTTKLRRESYLAKLYREFDVKVTGLLSDEIAVLSLYTLVGGCVKDFGFDTIMQPLCEIFYCSIIEEYPLMAKTSKPFVQVDSIKKEIYPPSRNSGTTGSSLSSLAAIASDIQSRQSDASRCEVKSPKLCNDHQQLDVPFDKSKFKGDRKSVTLKFASSKLEFSYPPVSAAAPRFIEIIENARSAFKLSSMNNAILGLKNSSTGAIINSDSDLEKIFKTQEKIELEIFTQRSKAIPIYEITSTVIPSKYKDDSPKIILPPLYDHRSHLLHQRSNGLPPLDDSRGLKFLSNSEESVVPPPPPQPVLPKFQPLL